MIAYYAPTFSQILAVSAVPRVACSCQQPGVGKIKFVPHSLPGRCQFDPPGCGSGPLTGSSRALPGPLA